MASTEDCGFNENEDSFSPSTVTSDNSQSSTPSFGSDEWQNLVPFITSSEGSPGSASFTSSAGEPPDFTSSTPIAKKSQGTTPIVLGSRRQKQAHPRRSPTLDDPNFRGVLIHATGKFLNGEWKLIMKYLPSKEALLGRKRRRRRRKPYFSPSDTEDEETSMEDAASTSAEKHCASCSANKTPLWRDAEDGTPLCNACGIRYKKYKVRCGHCWHIPKKDENSPCCKLCGSNFQHGRSGHW